MKKPDIEFMFEFAADFKSLLPIPAVYFDWEGVYFSIHLGWLFWNVKFEWEKKS